MRNIVILLMFFSFSCASVPGTKENVTAGKDVWTGSWESCKESANGKLYVLLPAEIPFESEFTAPAIIYYSYLYFFELQKRVELACRINTDNAAESGKNFPQKDIRIKITAKVPGSGQLIEFTAIMNEEKTIVTGGYRTANPADIGYFFLHKSD